MNNLEWLYSLEGEERQKWFDAEHVDGLPEGREIMHSYSERLYGVDVSDCPYCGCERVIIHDYDESYESPHDYRVEHMDEREACTEGCFEMYFAFSSVEDAVKHANMRDGGDDGEPFCEKVGRWLESDAPSECRECDDGKWCELHDQHESCAQHADQREPEKVDGGESYDSREFAANRRISRFDASESGETVENGAAKDGICNFDADSREKLEADVRKHYAYSTTTLLYPPSANKTTDMLRSLPIDTVVGWLDRQAAITEREGREEWKKAASGEIYRAKLKADELIAERDKLKSYVDDVTDDYAKLVMERDELKAKVHDMQIVVDCVDERNKRYCELVSERDNLARDLQDCNREREKWRDLCGRMQDASHEVGRIADEGMA